MIYYIQTTIVPLIANLFQHGSLVRVKYIHHTAQFLDCCQSRIVGLISVRLVKDDETTSDEIVIIAGHVCDYLVILGGIVTMRFTDSDWCIRGSGGRHKGPQVCDHPVA